jgi:antitoxin MazE
MQTKVQKWGNSLAIRIPSAFVSEIGFGKDAEIEMNIVDGKLIVTPAPKQQFSLAALLSKIDESNVHHETDTGVPQGSEIW